MSKRQTLLFVGAHPDDETFGIGGTLAQYAAAGVNVYYACATRGEAGMAEPEHMKGYATSGDMRWAELKCASRTLGLADVIYLGYRDSGMPGSEDNKHPEALAVAPLGQVVGRVVKVIRDLRPEVIITSDPIGGYQHPDHIAIHKATLRAFYTAGNPDTYPEAGSAFNPQKLYFSVFPHRLLKVAIKLMPLYGQDPHRLGRNKDIDIARMVAVEFPIHAVVRLSKQAVAIRDKAATCYASQMGGGLRRRGLLGFLRRFSGPRDYYMREYPPSDSRRRETDLFEGTM
jgi:LmbE family N-acetylglucosaminyl deacetylase